MKGFTLIELLVVVMIVALGATLVSLNLGMVGRSQKLGQAAIEFANRSRGLAQEVVITGRTWGVDLYQENITTEAHFGYRWLELKAGRWVPGVPDQLEAAYSLPATVTLELEIEGSQRIIDELDPAMTSPASEVVIPDILLLGSGEMTPFALKFIDNERGQKAVVKGDLLGRIGVEQDAGKEP